tara:strand:- start:83 stop:526 length:444 start_codon:yes stop_codon:yes gene_type:complete
MTNGKYSTIRTLRGLLSTTSQRVSLVVDDGRLNHGHRITSIRMWPARASQVGDITVVLATTGVAATTPMNAGNNGQIGWVYAAFGSGTSFEFILDPNHIIVEELVITGDWGVNFADGVNYMITLEPIMLTDSESAVVQIKARQQNLV